MFWTVFSLLLLVVLGGFISYYGDLQGRRWGKKRVSWFGMRPKHTAILITSLTGAFISLLSIAALLVVSPTVRDVIYSGERALRENKRLTAQYHLDMAESKIKLGLAQQDIINAQQQQAKLQANITELRAQAERAGIQVTKLEARQKALLTQLLSVQTDLQHKEAENERAATVNNGLAKQNIGLEKQNGFYVAQNRTLAKANGNLVDKNGELTAQNRELMAQQGDLKRANDVLLEVNKTTRQANLSEQQVHQEALKANREELARVNEQLSKARLELAQALDDLAGSGQYFVTNYNRIKQGRISVRADAELARCVIDAHMPEDIITRDLNDLLDTAGKTAIKCGAAPGANGRAVRIMSKHLVTLTDEQYVYEKESLKTLAGVLAGSDKPVVVVVSAFSNAVEGEQVPVDLRSTAVVSMFPAGAVLASCHINAGLTDEQLKQAIAQFLQKDVRDAMVKAGAISQVDPLSGLSQVGQYDAIDLGLLAVRVRQMKGDVVLKAVAASAITSADPLDRNHLRLEVVRALGKES